MDIKKYLKNPYVIVGASAGILILVIYASNRRKVEYVQVPVYSSEPKTEPSSVSPSPIIVSENGSEFLGKYMEYMSGVLEEQHQENLVMQAQILEALRLQRESISTMPQAISESIVPVISKQVSVIEPYFEPYQVTTKKWTEEGYKPVTVTIDDPFEQRIMAAKQAYYEAEARNDIEAMRKAHEMAEQAREEAKKKGVVLREWARSGE